MLDRITKQQLLILSLLAEREEMYGIDLVKASDGVLGRGTVYVWLSGLQDEAMVVSRYTDEPPVHPGMLRRRLYRITDHGRGVLALSRRAHA